MSLTIVKRPQGHTLIPQTAWQATVSSSSGDALFTTLTNHGLSDGDFIHISSNVRDYNGFWYVDQQSLTTFKILEYATATAQPYVNNDTVTYYVSYINHGWSAVHLPIVYTIKSDLWPVNSVDTVRTVSSAVNSVGYTKLTVSGDIKAIGSANELDFVKLTVNGTEGIYQILQYISDTQFVIDLTFVGTNTYGNCQFYYNNYHARVKIYAGIKGTHKWAAIKPYAYLTEIKDVPDASNIIQLNISEYIKSQIDILSNDLLLGTLPNDINSWCNFYVTFAESYDQSLDGYTIGSYLSSYTDDSPNFEGLALNSKMPFKSLQSGFMSEYISGASATNPERLRKLLTCFEQPTMFDGFFFELSALVDANANDASVCVIQEAWKNGAYTGTFRGTPTTGILMSGTDNWGVLRVQLTTISDEDQQKIYLSSTSASIHSYLSQALVVNVNRDCSKFSIQFIWKNYLGGHDSFVFTALNDHGIEIGDTKESEVSILPNWPKSWDDTASTVNREIERISNESITVYSQNVSIIEIEGLKYLKTSPLVQIIVARGDLRTVIIDKSSFVVRKDSDKTFQLTFKATYTNTVPSQSL